MNANILFDLKQLSMVRTEILIPNAFLFEAKEMQKACRGLIIFNQRPVNLLVVLKPPSNASEDDLTTAEKQGLARRMDFFKFGIAYGLEHGTRPSTIGLVLASNPMALMAW